MKTHVIADAIAGNRYHAFRLGFGDGADGNRASTVFTRKDVPPDYERGYETGRAARRRALAKYAKEVGYDLHAAILREAPKKPGGAK